MQIAPRLLVPLIALCLGLVGCPGDGDVDVTEVEIQAPDITEEPSAVEPSTPSPQPEVPPGVAASASLESAIAAIPDDAREAAAPAGTSVENGKTSYESSCVFCHGASGKGDGAAAASLDPVPGDWSHPTRFGLTTAGEKAWIILDGVGGGSAMSGYRASMSEKQVWEIVTYLETLAPPADPSDDPAVDPSAAPAVEPPA